MGLKKYNKKLIIMTEKIGFYCCYTPLPIIHAAGYSPYRLLPLGEHPEQAGSFLHDNLCHNVKKIMDRALEGDFPPLTGVVFVNSCDAMRRLADAWRQIKPEQKVFLLDLPTTKDELSASFLAGELSRLINELGEWRGETVNPQKIEKSVEQYNNLTNQLHFLQDHLRLGKLKGGSKQMQSLYNLAASQSPEESLSFLKQIVEDAESAPSSSETVPVFLFGNVLPDPEIFSFFQSCGANITDEDLCSGSRSFNIIETADQENITLDLARALLARPACSRTIDTERPGKIAQDILDRAKAVNAKGIIGYVVKFCDPYLGRLPLIRQELQKAGMPFLLLEGDCSLRSIGQQRTRIEAFMEMLK